jgi:muramoyltetrapeptide carboxypeptidase
MLLTIPPFLQPGDTIAIAAPARSVSMDQIQDGIDFMQAQGFKMHLESGLFEVHNQLAGTDAHRAELFNRLLANPTIKAIWCARGGYGCARMVDQVDWNLLKQQPKWIAGFSDVTVLLSHAMQQTGVATMHSSMPVFMHNKTEQDLADVQSAFASLASALKGNTQPILSNLSNSININDFSGTVVGGNLSVLYSIMGSSSELDWTNTILFIEDLDEYFYHIDRMLLALKRAGKLKGLKALLVGSFIQMHDHTIPFGKDVKGIVLDHCAEYKYPIIFDVNVGHHLQNLCLPFGLNAEFKNGILTFVKA